MEPEFQRDRAREQQKRPNTFVKEEPKRSTTTTQPETYRRTFAREVDVAMGLMFIMIALVGMVVTDLMSAHLSYAHNIIHVVSGVLALVFAFRSERSARVFALSFGTVYGLLGILGFALGKPQVATVGHMAQDRFLWVLSPEILEFGTTDHILHVIFGAVFIAGALIIHKRKVQGSARVVESTIRGH
jgi:hypothetical protein